MKDRLYSQPLGDITSFTFSKEVTEAFDDMIERSVPFRQEVLHMTARLAAKFYQKDTCIYDLGSSKGALAVALLQQLGNRPFAYHGIDNSEHMVAAAEKNLSELAQLSRGQRIGFKCGDISELAYADASVLVANYTLQFIQPPERRRLLGKLHDQLRSGGIMIISEKVLENHGSSSQLFAELHHDFKERQGYTKLEIAQKRTALENVLVPYRLDEYKSLLSESGFDRIEVFFKWCNFVSLIAFKA